MTFLVCARHCFTDILILCIWLLRTTLLYGCSYQFSHDLFMSQAHDWLSLIWLKRVTCYHSSAWLKRVTCYLLKNPWLHIFLHTALLHGCSYRPTAYFNPAFRLKRRSHSERRLHFKHGNLRYWRALLRWQKHCTSETFRRPIPCNSGAHHHSLSSAYYYFLTQRR